MKEKIMPPLVLTVICAVISCLLVLAHDATYKDMTGVLTEDMEKGCEEIFGEGDYEIIMKDKKTPETFGSENINCVIVDRKNFNCVIEITEDGYAKDGLHILVGIDISGIVQGIEFLSIGETPGLGSKVQDNKFLGQFFGAAHDTDLDQLDNVTAATYSAKGMKKAVRECLDVYSNNKEAIIGG